MKIGVIGTGFVGLPLGAAFAKMGNEVWCLDSDIKKIEELNQEIIPIDEPGLEFLVKEGLRHKLLHFVNDYDQALANVEIIFIAVGTPPGKDGSADLSYVESVASEIGRKMTHSLIVADKSTVPVGTAEKVRAIIQNELDKRGENINFHVVSNPEFMAEGRAVKDMMEPSRVVVGTDNDEVAEKLRQLYKPFMMNSDRFFRVGIKEAEIIKYASNAILASRISFINAIAFLCEFFGADVEAVAQGMGSDPRIGNKFLHPSCGYGGSCFPKDVKALIKSSENLGMPAPYVEFLKAIENVNDYQKTIIPRKIIARFGKDLTGKKFALWGLAFKANTNDMRESAAITIIDELLRRGATVAAYDPLAVDEARDIYLAGRDVSYESQDYYAILEGCEALIVATETQEYRSPDFEKIKQLLRNPIIFDGRNIFDLTVMEKAGFEYYGIGRGKESGFQDIVFS